MSIRYIPGYIPVIVDQFNNIICRGTNARVLVGESVRFVPAGLAPQA